VVVVVVFVAVDVDALLPLSWPLGVPMPMLLPMLMPLAASCVVAVDVPSPWVVVVAAACLAAWAAYAAAAADAAADAPGRCCVYHVVVFVFLVTSCAHAQTEVLTVKPGSKAPTAHFGGCDYL
jgi:hypothetical protein